MKILGTSNCLFFSIKYKSKYPNSKIRFENLFINTIRKHGIGRSLFRYMKYTGFNQSLKFIFYPHFYIIDGKYRVDSDSNSNIGRYSKHLIDKKISIPRDFFN